MKANNFFFLSFQFSLVALRKAIEKFKKNHSYITPSSHRPFPTSDLKIGYVKRWVQISIIPTERVRRKIEK